ncbi:MAG: DnaA/Hda family protein [Chitinophagaceae bacterium]
MAAEQLNILCGYIEYVSSPVAFVTPVFKNDKSGGYCLQTRSMDNRHIEWETIPTEYNSLIIERIAQKTLPDTGNLIYGFKSPGNLIFATGIAMTDYLKSHFLQEAKEGVELARSFLQNWQETDIVTSPHTKEEIWKETLACIAEVSRTIPQILRQHIKPVSFENSVLTLKTADESVKKVFERFKEKVIKQFIGKIPGFQVDLISEAGHGLFVLPLVYYGGGDILPAQGSFFLETSINPYQDLDNYIIGDFNANAYHRTLDFINNKSDYFFSIRGKAGTGKTHLANSIAKGFTEKDRNLKVGFFRILTFPGGNEEVSETEIDQFRLKAGDYDIIIIDDAHKINRRLPAMERLVSVLKKWSQLGKKVVVSHDDEQMDLYLDVTFPKQLDQVILADPGEADKLKIIESKTSSHNIKLTGQDIIKLSEDPGIKTVADIQKQLARVYLSEELPAQIPHLFWSHSFNDLNSKWVESSVHDYFNWHKQFLVAPADASLNVKILSHFIQDLFIAPHHGTSLAVPQIAHTAQTLFYSFDALQYHLFENDRFKEVIAEIIRDILLKWNSSKP